jgi:cobalt/nickel transport system permease protein
MGAGHHRPLTLSGAALLPRLPPERKVAATVLFVVAVVVTPREQLWAFGAYASGILALALIAHVPLLLLVRRMAIEVPFIAFAVLLPFIGHGPQVEVLGMSLSVEGLWAAWNIIVKGTLGVAASTLLVATTDTRDILRGLERLHVPRTFVAIASFMVRYLEVIAGELRAMRIARASRGHDPRWFWQSRAITAAAGTLFVRSYERGERVYLAMAARGYDGTLPATSTAAEPTHWGATLLLPLGACAVAVIAWIVQ